MTTIYGFDLENWTRFKDSKYTSQMYKAKMTMQVLKTTKNHVIVEVGEGIDLDFLTDVYDPFMQEIAYESKNSRS